MASPIADWQLPPGVSRGLWDYFHNEQLASGYDDSLRDCALIEQDWKFVEEHCPKPGRVIDLGCGTGRMLVPLAQRGFETLGVDLSEEMLNVARRKAAEAGVPVQLLQVNIVDLGELAAESFDYALCLFSTLGMVVGREHRENVLREVHRLLKPGGVFVLHVHNRWFNFWDPNGRRWLWRDCLQSLTRSSARGDREMPAHDGQPPLTLHLFTRREVTGMLRRSGFRLLEVRPVGFGRDEAAPRPWWFGWLRAYGYLLACRKPPGD